MLLAAAAALRVAFALRKGLVLDELHTLFHARNLAAGGFLEALLADNHPPLGFLVVGAARALLGESELALRAPAILFGVAEIALVCVLARRFVPPRTALLASALVAASSLHLDFSSQARMYALHALAATALGLALVEAWRRPGARWPPVLACAAVVAGVLNHYFFVQYAIWLAFTWLGLAARGRRELRPMLLAALAALALLAPWLASGLRHQLGHGLPPGGDEHGLLGLAEAFVHLTFLNVRLGGPLLRVLFIACGLLAVLLALLGLARLVAGGRSPAAWLLAAGAFLVPAAAAALAQLAPRAGFTWHYLLPSLAPLACLFAAAVGPGRGRALRHAAAGTVLAAAALLALLNAGSRGTEDYPGAVARILAEWRPGDAVVTVEWHPRLFPQGLPWSYYAPRLAADPPRPLAMSGQEVSDRAALRAAERVLLLRSKLGADARLMRQLREDFDELWSASYGFGRHVHLFQRRAAR